jgi:hypothetical protein
MKMLAIDYQVEETRPLNEILRTRATRGQTAPAAAIDRAVMGIIGEWAATGHWAEIDRTEIAR